jgi:hypothetical protein
MAGILQPFGRGQPVHVNACSFVTTTLASQSGFPVAFSTTETTSDGM